MGISFKKGSFAGRVGTGTQDITDVGFQPKALIIWGTTVTADDTYNDTIFFSYGFSDGTTDCCTYFTSGDNIATSSSASNIYNDAIYQIGDASNDYGRATLNAWLSNGFQLNWQVAIGANILEYIAIGGTDITNVKVGTQSVGITTTGNKAYTGVGFQGDFLLTASNGAVPGAGAYTYNTTTEGNAGFVLGCAKSSTERWTISTASEHNRVVADCWRYQRGDKCFAYLNNSTGALLTEADFVSWDSDGFTWNYTTNTTANNQNIPIIYMAIKGGVWDVNYLQSPATNTTVVTNTNASATLKGIQTCDVGYDLITSTTISTTNIIHCGGSDGTTQGCASICDIDAADPTINARFRTASYTIYQFIAAAVAASSTIVGRATTTFATTSFTTTWTNTDGNFRYIPYWALSEFTGLPHSYGKIHTMFDNNLAGAIFG